MKKFLLPFLLFTLTCLGPQVLSASSRQELIVSKFLNLNGNGTGILSDRVKKDKSERQWTLTGYNWSHPKLFAALYFPAEDEIHAKKIGSFTPFIQSVKYDDKGRLLHSYTLKVDHTSTHTDYNKSNFVEKTLSKYELENVEKESISQVISNVPKGITLMYTANLTVSLRTNNGTVKTRGKVAILTSNHGTLIFEGFGDIRDFEQILSTLTLRQIRTL